MLSQYFSLSFLSNLRRPLFLFHLSVRIFEMKILKKNLGSNSFYNKIQKLTGNKEQQVWYRIQGEENISYFWPLDITPSCCTVYIRHCKVMRNVMNLVDNLTWHFPLVDTVIFWVRKALTVHLFSNIVEAIVVLGQKETYTDPISKTAIQNPVRNKLCQHVYERDTVYSILKKKKSMA